MALLDNLLFSYFRRLNRAYSLTMCATIMTHRAFLRPQMYCKLFRGVQSSIPCRIHKTQNVVIEPEMAHKQTKG